MQEPTVAGWEAVKRVARFLLGSPRQVWVWRRQNPRRHLSGYSDSDYAGQTSTRKSTSCTVEMLGQHLIGQSSTTQSNVTLSTGEAEYQSLVKTGSRMM